MQHKLEDDDDSFSFNENENKSLDFDDSTVDNLNASTRRMSSHSPSKHYPFSRRPTHQSLLDTDSEEDEQNNDKNPSRFISNPSEKSTQQSGKKLLSAGPSNRHVAERIKSPKPRQRRARLSSPSDTDESDEMGVTKKKVNVIPGEYDPTNYEQLDVSDEIKDIFQFITKYIPQQLNLDFKFKPFIPDFIPAVGDIDAFIKVVSPEIALSGDVYNPGELQLGLTVVDEPAANQSDPALLHLQLKAASISVGHSNQVMVVKKVDNIEKNSKIIDKWIKDVSELHKNKAAAVVRYSNPMPEVDDLMQEWPERFENAIKLHGIPSFKFCGSLSQYVDVVCAVFDIPVVKNKIQSLHVLFSLYAAIKNSQLYRAGAGNAFEGKDNAEINVNNKHNHLVLE